MYNVSAIGNIENTLNIFSNYPQLITPLSTSLSGTVSFGLVGSVIGFTFGTIDELAIYNGYYKHHYLSSGFLGGCIFSGMNVQYNAFVDFANFAGAGNVINYLPKATKYVIESLSTIAGFSLGVAVQSGLIKEEFVEVAKPIMALGSYTRSLKGGLLGLVIAGSDYILVNNNIIAHKYLSDFTVSYSMLAILKPSAIQFTNYGLSKISQSTPLDNDLLDKLYKLFIVSYSAYSLTKYEVSNRTENNDFVYKLYNNYNQLFEKDELDQLIERQVIFSVSKQILDQKLINIVAKYQQNVVAAYHTLNGENKKEVWIDFTNYLGKFAIIFPFKIIIDTIQASVSALVHNQLSFSLTQKMHDKIFDQEVLYRLKKTEDAEVLINNLSNDINNCYSSGSLLVADLVSAQLKSLISFKSILIENAVDVLSLVAIYEYMMKYMNNYTREKANSFEEEIREKSSNYHNLKKDIIDNLGEITKRSGFIVNKDMIEEEYYELNILSLQKTLWGNIANSINAANSVLGFFINYFYVGYKIYSDQLDFNQRHVILFNVDSAQLYLSWERGNAATIKEISISVDKIDSIISKVEPQLNEESNALRTYNFDEDWCIKFKNFSFGIGDKVLSKLNNVEIYSGIHAVIGKSGCGKSSFFSKLINIKNNNIWSKGEIEFFSPNKEEPKFTFITQNNYFLPNSSLISTIYYPNNYDKLNELEAANILDKVKNILIELEFNDSLSEEELVTLLNTTSNDWNKVLSGGQVKKAMLASAIISNGDLVILDETLTGLDKKSLLLAEKLIKEKFVNKIVFIIDHHAKEDNYQFYDDMLLFSQVSTEISPIDSSNKQSYYHELMMNDYNPICIIGYDQETMCKIDEFI